MVGLVRRSSWIMRLGLIAGAVVMLAAGVVLATSSSDNDQLGVASASPNATHNHTDATGSGHSHDDATGSGHSHDGSDTSGSHGSHGSSGSSHGHAGDSNHDHGTDPSDPGHNHGTDPTDPGHDHGGPPPIQPPNVIARWNTLGDVGASQGCANGGFLGGDHEGHEGHAVGLDQATQTAVDNQLDAAQAYALQFPTVASAKAAGYVEVTFGLPCIAAHYIKWTWTFNVGVGQWGWVDNVFDPTAPEMLLYSGTSNSSKLVGVSYMFHGVAPPAGFAGPNDGWHVHRGLCLSKAGVVQAQGTSQGGCQSGGSIWFDGADLWMAHAWVIPGYRSDLGVFSDGNNVLAAIGS